MVEDCDKNQIWHPYVEMYWRGGDERRLRYAELLRRMQQMTPRDLREFEAELRAVFHPTTLIRETTDEELMLVFRVSRERYRREKATSADDPLTQHTLDNQSTPTLWTDVDT